MLIEIYILKVLSLEQRNWQRIKKTKQEQIAMAKLYLYQAVDIVTQKGKESVTLLKVMNNEC
jgi:hypothetical protein